MTCGCGPIRAPTVADLPDPCTSSGLALGTLALTATGDVFVLGTDPTSPCGRGWILIGPNLEIDSLKFSNQIDLTAEGPFVVFLADEIETPAAVAPAYPYLLPTGGQSAIRRLSVNLQVANPDAAVDVHVYVDGVDSGYGVHYNAGESGIKDTLVFAPIEGTQRTIDVGVATNTSISLAQTRVSAVLTIQTRLPPAV